MTHPFPAQQPAQTAQPLALAVFFDFETTGLDPLTASPLELAACMVRLDAGLTVVAREFDTVWALPDTFAKECDAKVVDMHTRNGLFAACLERGWHTEQVSALFAQWLDVCFDTLGFANTLTEAVKAGLVHLYLAGRNVERFDRILLERLFPTLKPLFHYRVLDVQFARMAGRALGTPERFDVAGSSHRAIDDVYADIATVRKVFAVLKESA